MKFIPDLKAIEEMITPLPTLGELSMLKMLATCLRDFADITVYYQPKIGRGYADIVVVRNGYGCAIIEVKDWAVDAYQVTKGKGEGSVKWATKNGAHTVFSPHHQVVSYKKNLLGDLQLEGVQSNSPTLYTAFQTVIYLANTPHTSAVLYNHEYTACIGRPYVAYNSDQILGYLKLTKPNACFDDHIQRLIDNVIRPRSTPVDPVIKFNPSKRQSEALKLTESGRRKIRGCAGSGKTYVAAILAALRAEKGNRVLITVYNEAARWSFLNVIKRLDIGFPRQNVDVQTIFSLADPFDPHRKSNYAHSADYFKESQDLIINRLQEQRNHSDHILYDLLIIDEAQDYRIEWMDALEQHFLKPKGEFVILADEGQNIYGNSLDSRLVKTPISGPWFRLDEHKRSSYEISIICDRFRSEFLRYTDDNKKDSSLGLSITRGYPRSTDDLNGIVNDLTHICMIDSSQAERTNIGRPLIVSRTNIALRQIASMLGQRVTPDTTLKATVESEEERFRVFLESVKWLKDKNSGPITLDGREVTVGFNRVVNTHIIKQLIEHLDCNQPISDTFRLAERDWLIQPRSDVYSFDSLAELYRLVSQINIQHESGSPAQRGHYNNDLANVFSFRLGKLLGALKASAFSDDQSIVLSTVHSAKGIEREATVVIVDKYWDSLPNASELLYTALSRARNDLHVIYHEQSLYADFFKSNLGT